jgi:hypothetical protein
LTTRREKTSRALAATLACAFAATVARTAPAQEPPPPPPATPSPPPYSEALPFSETPPPIPTGSVDSSVPELASPPNPTAAPESSVTRRHVAFVAAGFAIAFAGVGTAFGIMTLQQKSDFDTNPTMQSYHDGTKYAVIADTCFGAAFALGVTSIVLLVESRGTTEPSAGKLSSFTPVPLVGAHMGGAGLHLSF